MRNVGLGTFWASNRAKELINEVLESGRISYGPLCKRFESEFTKIHGCKYGVLSNSGTSSLHVAVQALKEINKWRDGSEVLVPSVTFVATINVLLHNNLKPVLVDVESDYYGMDPKLVEKKITRKTVAMIPVHLFGMPCQMDRLGIIAEQRGLKIIEDSCESMFATLFGVSIGSWGDVACFSTYVAHLISTGVGGMGITNSPEIAARMRSLVNHGRDGIYISIDDDNDTKNKTTLKEVVSKRFKFEHIGHSFRITELEAALALAQLEDYKSMIIKRQANAETLTTHLRKIEAWLQLPSIRPGATHSYMMYPIMLKFGDKWALCNYLEQNGIETREMLPLTNQPCYKGMWKEKDYPVAQNINKNGFYVGCHQELNNEDMVYIAEKINQYGKDTL
jgi:perosamine synthetase